VASSRASLITLRTRRRRWWEWWLIAAARRLHELTGDLLARLER